MVLNHGVAQGKQMWELIIGLFDLAKRSCMVMYRLRQCCLGLPQVEHDAGTSFAITEDMMSCSICVLFWTACMTTACHLCWTDREQKDPMTSSSNRTLQCCAPKLEQCLWANHMKSVSCLPLPWITLYYLPYITLDCRSLLVASLAEKGVLFLIFL